MRQSNYNLTTKSSDIPQHEPELARGEAIDEFIENHPNATKEEIATFVDKITNDPEFIDIYDSLDESQPQNNGGMGLYPPQEWGEIDPVQVLDTLSLTIKADHANKFITFLSELLTYTDEDQINLMFNAPSSAGKSYLALETVSLFPKEDVLKIAYASPTAFWYSNSEYDEEREVKLVDLERKIIVFLDMPYFELLQKIRSLLSKDEKEISIRVTNRSKKGENRADHIIVRGYPTVIFASASFELDDQEMTRFIMLSPETSKEKVDAAIREAAIRVSDNDKYLEILNSNPLRIELMSRIRDIRNFGIKEVIIPDFNKLLNEFTRRYENSKARHARDIKRVAALAKGFALLNLWTRKRKDRTLFTDDIDLENAFILWDEIYLPQELGLPPFVYEVYEKVILPAYEEKGVGLTRQDIQKKFTQTYHTQLPLWKLSKEYLPMLNASGVVSEEDSPTDKRIKLLFPIRGIENKGGSQPHSPIYLRLKSKVNYDKDKEIEGISRISSLPSLPSEKSDSSDSSDSNLDTPPAKYNLVKERDELKLKLPMLEGTDIYPEKLKRYQEIVEQIGEK